MNVLSRWCLLRESWWRIVQSQAEFNKNSAITLFWTGMLAWKTSSLRLKSGQMSRVNSWQVGKLGSLSAVSPFFLAGSLPGNTWFPLPWLLLVYCRSCRSFVGSWSVATLWELDWSRWLSCVGAVFRAAAATTCFPRLWAYPLPFFQSPVRWWCLKWMQVPLAWKPMASSWAPASQTQNWPVQEIIEPMA